MMIKFLAHGTGSAAKAADYLTRERFPERSHCRLISAFIELSSPHEGMLVRRGLSSVSYWCVSCAQSETASGVASIAISRS